MPRKSASKSGAGTDLSFEQALQQLESLVEAMESDQLPLEELVAHYEKGAGLLQHCEKTLAAARKRIELIELTPPPGEKGLESGEEPAEDSHSASDTAGEEGDDVRLL